MVGKKIVFFVCVLIFLSGIIGATEINSSNYGMNSVTLSGGGENVSSSNYETNIVLSIPSGNASSSNHVSSFGLFYSLSYCGDGNCDSDESCSSCSVDCGICPVSPVSPSGGSGGGGGGGAGVVAPITKFIVSPQMLDKTIALNKIESGEIVITNKGDDGTFEISVETIENIIEIDKESIEIKGDEEKKVGLRFIAPEETGMYAGKIIVSSGDMRKEILVTINVKTEKSLFDVNIIIPSELKDLEPGKNINAQINLIQMGVREKMDVTLNYVIKDFVGKTYLSESETLAVTDQKSFIKEFETRNLPINNYVVGVELIYPDGVAVSSSHFKVSEKYDVENNQLILIGIIVVLIVILTTMIFLIQRYKKAKKLIKNRKR